MNTDEAGDEEGRPRPFEAIEETKHWIAINKPAGLLIHPSKPADRCTLWDHLRELFAFELATGGSISIINRLDRETSGVVLVTKTREAARALGRVMKEGRMRKSYLAIVWGWPAEDDFRVDAPLLRLGAVQEARIWLKRGIHEKGLAARTSFRVLKRFEAETTAGRRFAVVRATPETGRTHQIRVHLASTGHPVVGDKIYGPDEGLYLEFIETGWTDRLQSLLLLDRHALHSERLGWTKPDGTEQELHAPWPADLAGFAGPVSD